MSVQTCRLNLTNPFECLAALREHDEEMRQDPFAWLPWNFRKTMAAGDTS